VKKELPARGPSSEGLRNRHEKISMIKSDQNHSYIFVSDWQYAFLANYQFFQSFTYTQFYFWRWQRLRKKRALLSAFWRGNNQLAEWNQLDLSSPSRIFSSPIFSSERLLPR
jgi:hypothetical protein